MDYNLVIILIKVGCFIEISELGNHEEIYIKLYQYLINKLMYLSFGTRPDIAFTVSQLSKCNLKLRVDHMKDVKKVVMYLKKIIHIELVYELLFQSKTPAVFSAFGLIR